MFPENLPPDVIPALLTHSGTGARLHLHATPPREYAWQPFRLADLEAAGIPPERSLVQVAGTWLALAHRAETLPAGEYPLLVGLDLALPAAGLPDATLQKLLTTRHAPGRCASRGYVEIKWIKQRPYAYLRYREGGRLRSVYLGKATPPTPPP